MGLAYSAQMSWVESGAGFTCLTTDNFDSLRLCWEPVQWSARHTDETRPRVCIRRRSQNTRTTQRRNSLVGRTSHVHHGFTHRHHVLAVRSIALLLMHVAAPTPIDQSGEFCSSRVHIRRNCYRTIKEVNLYCISIIMHRALILYA